MNILVIGSGGREHAFAWKIKQGKDCGQLYVAPGNAGTASVARNVNIAVEDFEGLGRFCKEKNIGLVVVGPEAPLVKGIRDYFEADPSLRTILMVGPGKSGARLEGSKDFSKQFMVGNGIPTGKAETFVEGQLAEAYRYLEGTRPPIVLKADGLAAGKGVVICPSVEEAKTTIREMLEDKKFGEASSKVLIEEFLDGIELSVFVLTDGKDYALLPEAKDYKRIGENDTGPNTGGMGTCSPNPVWTERMSDEVMESVAGPIIDYMRDQGMPFRGVLFIGLMLTWHGPKVLEFNVRFGDPETQVMMPRIKTDLLPVLFQSARGRLEVQDLEIDPQHAVCVVLSAAGYPDSPRKGDVITGIPESGPDQVVFHAGTAHGRDHEVITSGGRVMGATAWAGNLETARKRAYKVANQVQFEGKYMRKDIGLK